MGPDAVRALGQMDAALAAKNVDEAAEALNSASAAGALTDDEAERIWNTVGRHHLGADPGALPRIGAPGLGGVRGGHIYPLSPTKKIGPSDLESQAKDLAKGNYLKGAKVTVGARVDNPPTQYLVVTISRKGEPDIVVEMRVLLRSTEALPETATHAISGGAGSARLDLKVSDRAGVNYEATVHLDNALPKENVPLVLGHEIDEAAERVAGWPGDHRSAGRRVESLLAAHARAAERAGDRP